MLIKNVITDVISERPMIYDKLRVEATLINVVPTSKKSMGDFINYSIKPSTASAFGQKRCFAF